MNDSYLEFATSMLGGRITGLLGLPQPAPLERFQAGEPVIKGPVLIGAIGIGDTINLAFGQIFDIDRRFRFAILAHFGCATGNHQGQQDDQPAHQASRVFR